MSKHREFCIEQQVCLMFPIRIFSFCLKFSPFPSPSFYLFFPIFTFLHPQCLPTFSHSIVPSPRLSILHPLQSSSNSFATSSFSHCTCTYTPFLRSPPSLSLFIFFLSLSLSPIPFFLLLAFCNLPSLCEIVSFSISQMLIVFIE